MTERQTVVQYRAPLVPPDHQDSLEQRDQQGHPGHEVPRVEKDLKDKGALRDELVAAVHRVRQALLERMEEMVTMVLQVFKVLQAPLDLLVCKVLLVQLVPRGHKGSLEGMALPV